jgi:predicted nucleic acid-binding protein
VRTVLDPNVLVAALLSPSGTPATLIVRWLAGDYELLVSGDKHLLDLANAFPIRTPREFSDSLESGP